MLGRTLGHYRIVEKLGEGGMGVVYRARDENLNRDAAIKVLPEAFSRDGERLARFRREAQLLACLNHPNIAAVYGFEEQDGVRYLAQEYVPGVTLAERLASGALPVDETLDVCRQIAEAVEAAHEKGIVHRDLKPANVKVTPDGKVKVLDFGLAKAFEPAGSAAAVDISDLPTISTAATRAGVILGTAAYMSPEQARGRTVDTRTDIWAFGCVVYECLTGRRAFGGDNVTDTIAAVVTKEPDWVALPAGTPAHVPVLLRRCLRKDVRKRLQHVGDARLELEEPGVAAEPVISAAPRRVLPWAIAAAAAAIALTLAVFYLLETPDEQRLVKLAVMPPAGTDLGSTVVSPDGRRLVLVARDAFGRALMYVRELDSLDARPLAGTEGANYPFWSPDSRWVGFVSGGKLKKVEVSGGPPVAIADAPTPTTGSWSREGVIVFSLGDGRLVQVSAAGGEPTGVTELDTSRHESSHRLPCFLPDGRRFLYLALSSKPEYSGVYLASLSPDGRGSKRLARLVAGQSSVEYAGPASGPGYLLFLRERTLMAQRFDPATAALSGEAVPVAQPLGVGAGVGKSAFSVSSNGVLVYEPLHSQQLAWYDRSGKRLETVGLPGAYFSIEISRDGNQLAASRADDPSGNIDVWLFDLLRTTNSRFTFHPATESLGIWSPDGSRVVFYSSQLGPRNVYQKAVRGSGEEQLLLRNSVNDWPTDWSHDGRFVLYHEDDPNTKGDLWVLPVSGSQSAAGGKPIPFLHSDFNERHGQFSPDDRWVAYHSDESGRNEVYVRPFLPGGGTGDGEWQVSTGGGTEPRWRPDGKELFYLSPDRKLMAVDVEAGASRFRAGIPRVLFATRRVPAVMPGPRFAVGANGQRFLLNEQDEPSGLPATVILNWTAALR